MTIAMDLVFQLLGFGVSADVSKRSPVVRQVHVQKAGRLIRRAPTRDGVVLQFVALEPSRELSASEIEKTAHAFLAARQGPDREIDEGFVATESFLIPRGMKLSDAEGAPIPAGSWLLSLRSLDDTTLGDEGLGLLLGIEAEEVVVA